MRRAVILTTVAIVAFSAVPVQAGFLTSKIKHAGVTAAAKLKDGGAHGHPTFNNPDAGSPVVEGGGSDDAELASIRACESGGDYTINTGNGFLGAYQYMQSTWDGAASSAGYGEYSGTPVNEVPPGVQDAVTRAYIDAGNRGAWPNC